MIAAFNKKKANQTTPVVDDAALPVEDRALVYSAVVVAVLVVLGALLQLYQRSRAVHASKSATGKAH